MIKILCVHEPILPWVFVHAVIPKPLYLNVLNFDRVEEKLPIVCTVVTLLGNNKKGQQYKECDGRTDAVTELFLPVGVQNGPS